MADCSTIQANLADAQASYHALLTGKSLQRFVDQNGESVLYTAANKDSLKAYIDTLKNDLAICQGQSSGRSFAGPLTFVFGRRPHRFRW